MSIFYWFFAGFTCSFLFLLFPSSLSFLFSFDFSQMLLAIPKYILAESFFIFGKAKRLKEDNKEEEEDEYEEQEARDQYSKELISNFINIKILNTVS